MSKLTELLERTEPLAEDALAEAIEGHPLADVLLTLLREVRGQHAPAEEAPAEEAPAPEQPAPEQFTGG